MALFKELDIIRAIDAASHIENVTYTRYFKSAKS